MRVWRWRFDAQIEIAVMTILQYLRVNLIPQFQRELKEEKWSIARLCTANASQAPSSGFHKAVEILICIMGTPETRWFTPVWISAFWTDYREGEATWIIQPFSVVIVTLVFLLYRIVYRFVSCVGVLLFACIRSAIILPFLAVCC